MRVNYSPPCAGNLKALLPVIYLNTDKLYISLVIHVKISWSQLNITYLCVLSCGESSVRQHFHPLFPFAASHDFGLPAGRRGVRGTPGTVSLPAAGVGTQRELTLTLNSLSPHRLWEQPVPSLYPGTFLAKPPRQHRWVWGCRGAAPGQGREISLSRAPTLRAPLLGWEQTPSTELEGETLGQSSMSALFFCPPKTALTKIQMFHFLISKKH